MTKPFDIYNIDLSPKLCYRCLHYGIPKVKRGKEQWKGHVFVMCSRCSCKVFFS